MLDLNCEFLYDLHGDLEEPIDVGSTPHGFRRIFNIKGGIIEGPKIRGKVLPTGADWVIIRPDKAAEPDVRAILQTDDEIIYTYYRGILNDPSEVFNEIQNGVDVDPAEYYFRTTPYFETSSEKYGWLNRVGKIVPIQRKDLTLEERIEVLEDQGLIEKQSTKRMVKIAAPIH